MPDEKGKLTPEDHQKIKDWWGLHWKGPLVCPVCQESNWQTGDYVVYAARFSDDLPGEAPTIPLITISCTTCAHVLMFGAVPIGILPGA
jgi:hypothetical protein